MGRALKIQKYGTAQGITINSDGTVNQPAAAVVVDQGYPNFGSLTDPVYNSAGTLSAADFLGVVGGLSTTATTASYPISVFSGKNKWINHISYFTIGPDQRKIIAIAFKN